MIPAGRGVAGALSRVDLPRGPGAGLVPARVMSDQPNLGAHDVRDFDDFPDHISPMGLTPDSQRFKRRRDADVKLLRESEPLADFKARIEKKVGAPPVSDADLDAWVDQLSGDDVERIWADQSALWRRPGSRSGSSVMLWDRITGRMLVKDEKGPNGRRDGDHEWLMRTMLPDLRRLDVKMAEIRSMDFRTPTGELRLKDPNTGRISTHKDASRSEGSSQLSYDFHIDLARAIQAGAEHGDRSVMDFGIGQVALKYLPGGIADLPLGLQRRIYALDPARRRALGLK